MQLRTTVNAKKIVIRCGCNAIYNPRQHEEFAKGKYKRKKCKKCGYFYFYDVKELTK